MVRSDVEGGRGAAASEDFVGSGSDSVCTSAASQSPPASSSSQRSGVKSVPSSAGSSSVRGVGAESSQPQSKTTTTTTTTTSTRTTTHPMGALGMMQQVKGRQDFQRLLEARQDLICRYHTHELEAHQCGSILLQQIKVPLRIVWAIVRSFDKPQVYKRFIQTCKITEGDGGVGSIREVHLVSSVPATCSIERLEILDDEKHIISFRVLGGGHRLQNYSSVSSLHELEVDGHPCTLVLESYMVDIPDGNTREETHMFVDTVVRCNLKSLAQISEQQYSKECSHHRQHEQQQMFQQRHQPLSPIPITDKNMERSSTVICT